MPIDPLELPLHIETRDEFEDMLNNAQTLLKPESICITCDIGLTSEDLLQLVRAFKANKKTIQSLTILNNPKLNELPDLSELKLEELCVKRCGFTTLPDLSGLKELTALEFPCTKNVLPGAQKLVTTHNIKLRFIDVSGWPLNSSPHFNHLPDLLTIDLSNCNLDSAPFIFDCKKLKSCKLDNNKIVISPSFASNLELEYLNLGNNLLETPPQVEMCLKLKTLFLDNNNIHDFDVKLPNKLENLFFRDNPLEKMPDLSNCKELIVCSYNNSPIIFNHKDYARQNTPQQKPTTRKCVIN